jgi:hypothetical protein
VVRFLLNFGFMAVSTRFRARIATSMSGFAVAFALAAIGTPARAAEPPHAVTTATPPADDLDARHRVGIQMGGSSFVQVVYRLRMFGHVYLDVGGGGAPEAAMNGSLGIFVARSTGTRFYPYAAGGAGFGVAGGGPSATNKGPTGKCVDGTDGCPWESDSVAYGYARAGVGMTVGVAHRVSLLLDLGVWAGRRYHYSDDGMGTATQSSERFVWPIPGLAGFVSF